MELVYLWVEEYKNIKKQGFNFSSNVICNYDEEKKKLDIQHREHIENFFDDAGKINVTAIVGENGSGKSSVAKIILMLIFYKKFQNIVPIDITEKNILNSKIQILKKYHDKFFLLIKDENSYKKITLGEKYNTLPYDEIEDIDFFSIHFNYMLDTLYDGHVDDWIKSIYHRNDGYSTPVLLEPYKNVDNEEKIDLKIIEYLSNQRMLKFYSQITSDKNIISFFNPNKIKLSDSKVLAWGLQWREKAKKGQFTYWSQEYEMSKLVYKFHKLKKEEDFLDIFQENGVTKNIIESIEDLLADKKQNFLKINKLYVVFKVLTSKSMLINQEVKKILVDIIKRNKNKRLLMKSLIKELKLDNVLLDRKSFEVAKIEKCILFDKKYREDEIFKIRFNSAFDTEINTIYDIKEILEFIPSWMEVEFFEDDKSIKSLSSGEKGFFSFLINILYQLTNIKEKEEYKSINLFLDETDIGFHPEWQRKYVANVVHSVAEVWDKNINIIFLTHSPFLLSDMPNSNVIFLSKDNNGNCQVANGLKDKKQTFGANIHTLLSDGFFMQSGLIGQFAKEKIDQAIKYLNRRHLSENEIIFCENIISIIGEPIIKNQLQKMLDSKRLYKIGDIHQKIKDMEYELEVLKKYQNSVVKDEIKDRAKRKYHKKKKDDTN